jgi:hypothetical protein
MQQSFGDAMVAVHSARVISTVGQMKNGIKLTLPMGMEVAIEVDVLLARFDFAPYAGVPMGALVTCQEATQPFVVTHNMHLNKEVAQVAFSFCKLRHLHANTPASWHRIEITHLFRWSITNSQHTSPPMQHCQ